MSVKPYDLMNNIKGTKTRNYCIESVWEALSLSVFLFEWSFRVVMWVKFHNVSVLLASLPKPYAVQDCHLFSKCYNWLTALKTWHFIYLYYSLSITDSLGSWGLHLYYTELWIDYKAYSVQGQTLQSNLLVDVCRCACCGVDSL